MEPAAMLLRAALLAVVAGGTRAQHFGGDPEADSAVAGVSVSSGDGLSFAFGSSGTGIAGVTVGGTAIGTAKDLKLTGFGAADYLVPTTPTGLGPELLKNSDFAQAGTNATTAAGWTAGGAPHLDGFISRVSNVSHTAGGFSMEVEASGGNGAGASQGVTFSAAHFLLFGRFSSRFHRK